MFKTKLPSRRKIFESNVVCGDAHYRIVLRGNKLTKIPEELSIVFIQSICNLCSKSGFWFQPNNDTAARNRTIDEPERVMLFSFIILQ